MGDPGRLGVARGRPGTRPVGHLGRQISNLGRQDRPSWAPRWPTWAPSWPCWAPSRQTSAPDRPSRATLSSFASPNALRHPCGSIFDRFSVDTRTLRCAFCTIAASVLLMSDVFRVERSSHKETIEKTAVLGSKIDARGAPERPGRPSSNAKTAKTSKKACSKHLRGLTDA